MLWLLALIVLAVLAATAPQPSPDVPYRVRLKNVRLVAAGYPVGGPDTTANPLGEWAGIYYFTLWQKDSGRDGLPIWEVVNRQFTIEPLAIAEALAADPLFDCSVHTTPAVCRRWVKALEHGAGRRGRTLLWNAHVTALAHALEVHRDELAATGVQQAELRFWRGRTCLVFQLQRVGFPMIAESIRPIIGELEPQCSPLGSAGCRVRDLEPLERRAYVRMMLRWGATPERLERCAAGSWQPRSRRFLAAAAGSTTRGARAATADRRGALARTSDRR